MHLQCTSTPSLLAYCYYSTCWLLFSCSISATDLLTLPIIPIPHRFGTHTINMRRITKESEKLILLSYCLSSLGSLLRSFLAFLNAVESCSERNVNVKYASYSNPYKFINIPTQSGDSSLWWTLSFDPREIILYRKRVHYVHKRKLRKGKLRLG